MNEITDKFKNWLIDSGNNPVFWIGIFFAGLLVFTLTYNYLGKGKS